MRRGRKAQGSCISCVVQLVAVQVTKAISLILRTALGKPPSHGPLRGSGSGVRARRQRPIASTVPRATLACAKELGTGRSASASVAGHGSAIPTAAALAKSGRRAVVTGIRDRDAALAAETISNPPADALRDAAEAIDIYADNLCKLGLLDVDVRACAAAIRALLPQEGQ